MRDSCHQRRGQESEEGSITEVGVAPGTNRWRRKKAVFSMLGEEEERYNSGRILRARGRKLREFASEGLAVLRLR